MIKLFTLILFIVQFQHIYSIEKKCQSYSIYAENIYTCTWGQGTPTILLEAGLGNGIEDWEDFPNQIAQFARVIAYDRIGTGKSSNHYHQQPMTAEMASQVLIEVLKHLNVKPPIIIIGHSLGGLYAQYFARKHPEIIQGIILLDSASPNEPRNGKFASRSPSQPGTSAWWEMQGTYPTFDQILVLPRMNIPAIVIAADAQFGINPNDKDKNLVKEWLELQTKLVFSSTQGEFVLAKGSGHDIYRDQPNLVIDNIKK